LPNLKLVIRQNEAWKQHIDQQSQRNDKVEHFQSSIAGMDQVFRIERHNFGVNLGCLGTVYHSLIQRHWKFILYFFFQLLNFLLAATVCFITRQCSLYFICFFLPFFLLCWELLDDCVPLLAPNLGHDEDIGNSPELFASPGSIEGLALLVNAVAVYVWVQRAQNFDHLPLECCPKLLPAQQHIQNLSNQRFFFFRFWSATELKLLYANLCKTFLSLVVVAMASSQEQLEVMDFDRRNTVCIWNLIFVFIIIVLIVLIYQIRQLSVQRINN